MTRILELYDQPAAGRIPDGGRVVCVDEFGPLKLQHRPRRGWSPAIARPGSARPFTATAGSGTCSARWTWPRAGCSTASVTANAGRSSWRSCASFGPGSRPGGSTSCVTTSPRTQRARPRSPPGAQPQLRVGVLPHQRHLAELDRVRVHRAALLHPRRQRHPIQAAQEASIAAYPVGLQAHATASSATSGRDLRSHRGRRRGRRHLHNPTPAPVEPIEGLPGIRHFRPRPAGRVQRGVAEAGSSQGVGPDPGD